MHVKFATGAVGIVGVGVGVGVGVIYGGVVTMIYAVLFSQSHCDPRQDRNATL